MSEIKLSNTIKEVPIEKLNLYANNPRVHTDEQIKGIAESIKAFGFIFPILITKEKDVITGHGRIKAAETLGMKKVRSVEADGLTEDEKRALIIIDNRLSETSHWDNAKLYTELKDLKESGFDISIAGIDTFLVGSDFTPNLEPTANTINVTEADVEKSVSSQKNQMSEKIENRQNNKEKTDIICPYCHKEFTLTQ